MILIMKIHAFGYYNVLNSKEGMNMGQIKVNKAINQEINTVKGATNGLSRAATIFGYRAKIRIKDTKLPTAELYMDDHLTLTRTVAEFRRMVLQDMKRLESSVDTIEQADKQIAKGVAR